VIFGQCTTTSATDALLEPGTMGKGFAGKLELDYAPLRKLSTNAPLAQDVILTGALYGPVTGDFNFPGY